MSFLKKEDDKKQTTVSIALPIEMCKRIDVLAQKDERPRSYWVRTAIKEKLEREENEMLFHSAVADK